MYFGILSSIRSVRANLKLFIIWTLVAAPRCLNYGKEPTGGWNPLIIRMTDKRTGGIVWKWDKSVRTAANSF